MNTLVWLHRDLRIAANPALAWAARDGRTPRAVYVHAPDEESPWAPGGASRWWLQRSLGTLGTSLARCGIALECTTGPSAETLLRLAREHGADAIAWNRRHLPHLAARDAEVARALRDHGLEVAIHDDGLLLPPERMLKDDGTPYRVYTPFARRLRRNLAEGGPALPGAPRARRGAVPYDDSALRALALPDPHPWHAKLASHWTPGEDAAWSAFERFLDGALPSYAERRDIPGETGTSRLSPHLACGEITPAQLLARLQPWLDGAHGADAARGAERFFAELLWREFAYHVLVHFPTTPERSLDARFESGIWRDDAPALRRWQRGETGFALVDAGMRELWETGWMHNRVRMVAASFLVKQLGVHWRHGAAWFWDTLVDADLANNTLGWQWVAGCGVDAAPYYRIFNPRLQADKFDGDRRYRERWQATSDGAAPLDLSAAREAALDRYRRHVRKEKR